MNKELIDKISQAILDKHSADKFSLYLLGSVIEALQNGDDVPYELIERTFLKELNKELLKKD